MPGELSAYGLGEGVDLTDGTNGPLDRDDEEEDLTLGVSGPELLAAGGADGRDLTEGVGVLLGEGAGDGLELTLGVIGLLDGRLLTDGVRTEGTLGALGGLICGVETLRDAGDDWTSLTMIGPCRGAGVERAWLRELEDDGSLGVRFPLSQRERLLEKSFPDRDGVQTLDGTDILLEEGFPEDETDGFPLEEIFLPLLSLADELPRIVIPWVPRTGFCDRPLLS